MRKILYFMLLTQLFYDGLLKLVTQWSRIFDLWIRRKVHCLFQAMNSVSEFLIIISLPFQGLRGWSYGSHPRQSMQRVASSERPWILTLPHWVLRAQTNYYNSLPHLPILFIILFQCCCIGCIKPDYQQYNPALVLKTKKHRCNAKQ